MSGFKGGELGSLVVSIAADASGLQESMEQAVATVESGMSKIEAAAELAKGLFAGLGVGLSTGAFVQIVDAAIDAADEVGKMAQKFGVATEEMSRLQYTAGLLDVDAGALTQGIKGLSNELSNAAAGAGQSAAIFGALGVSVKGSAGVMKSAVGILPEIADKFAVMADGATKSALAVELFGRSGLEFIPALNAGGAAIRAAYEEAEIFSKIVGDDFAASADAFNDSTFRLRTTMQGLALSIAERLLPGMNMIIGGFTDAVARMNLFRAENEEISASPELFSWADAAARSFALIADGIANAVSIIEIGGHGIAHMAQIVTSGLEMLWIAGKRATLSISESEFDRQIAAARAKMEAGVRETDTAMQWAIDEMLNRPTFRDAMERQIARQGEIEVPVKPKISAEGQRKLEDALNAAMAKGDASSRAAEREAERQRRAEERAIEQLQSRLDKEMELTQVALTYREIVDGSYSKFSAGTKQRLLDLANEIDLNKELAEEEARLAVIQKSRMDILKISYNESKAIFDQTRTAAEKLEEDVAKLGEAFLDGYVSQERAVRRFNELMEESDEATRRLTEAGEQFGNVFSSAFEDAVIEMRNFGDVMESLIDDIFRMITRLMVTEPLEKLIRGVFGSLGKASGGGGDDLMSSLAGLGIFSGMAQGGRFFAGQPMMVGERGTETIYPLTSGVVIPNGGMGGAPKITVNVVNNTNAPVQDARVTDMGNGEYQVDVIVGQAISRMASDGRLDGLMGAGYGLRRAVVAR